MKKLIMVLIIAAMAVIILPQAALAINNPEVELSAEIVVLTEVNGVKHIIAGDYLDEDYTGTVTFIQVSDIGTDIIIIKSGSHDVLFDGFKSKPIHIKASEAPPISVESGTLTLTIRGNVTLEVTGKRYAGLRVAEGATATITTEQYATLTVKGGVNGAGIGGNSGEHSGKIILDGSGTITATISDIGEGMNGGAGIGGGDGGDGTVTINGGSVTATGNCNSAGIGGGDGGDGTVTINGGMVTATVIGGNGAGIGGGNGGDGNVNISDGVIIATGDVYGAGIGGGGSGSGNVTINKGTVTATGGEYGAGIGGGDEGSGNVTIKNGTVTATGGEYGAGIGGGNKGSGDITINDGTVTATGGRGGAGIGGGSGIGSVGKVTIEGGAITATGGDGGAGIGGGYNGSGTVTIESGTITAMGGGSGAGIGGGYEGDGTVTINGGNIIATGGSFAAGIGGGEGGSAKIEITGSVGSTILAKRGARSDDGVGLGKNGDSVEVSIDKMVIYSAESAVGNPIQAYNGQSPVYMVFNNDMGTMYYGNTNTDGTPLKDVIGNEFRSGITTKGSYTMPVIRPLTPAEQSAMHNYVIGTKVHFVATLNITPTGGRISSVGFVISNASVDKITKDAASKGMAITNASFLHLMSNGKPEFIPAVAKTSSDGQYTVYTMDGTPTSASPFALLFHMSPAPKPPKTGDSNQPLIWLSLLLICGAGLTVLLVRKRRKV